MGGRLDAVNIVDADVAVVVSLGIDHAEWLGPDLESIAREKAGIFRAGRPAVFGGDEPPPDSLIDAARRTGAVLRMRGRDFREILRQDGRWDLALGAGHAVETLRELPLPALPGTAQVGNAATAIAALHELCSRLPLPRDAIASGLERVVLPGRFQRIAERDVEWILDVAHNPAAARVLAASLSATRGSGRTVAVCAMLADKDVPGVLAELRGCVDTWIAASTDGPRGLEDVELARRGIARGIELQPGGTVAEAMRIARGLSRGGDRIVVLGSFQTVGPALTELARAGLAVVDGRL
jgi:dihydrofolate synthase/folylpolyglutamate synthase